MRYKTGRLFYMLNIVFYSLHADIMEEALSISRSSQMIIMTCHYDNFPTTLNSWYRYLSFFVSDDVLRNPPGPEAWPVAPPSVADLAVATSNARMRARATARAGDKATKQRKELAPRRGPKRASCDRLVTTRNYIAFHHFEKFRQMTIIVEHVVVVVVLCILM